MPLVVVDRLTLLVSVTFLVVTIYAMPAGTVGEPKAALVPEGKVHDTELGKLAIRHSPKSNTSFLNVDTLICDGLPCCQ